MTQTGSTAQALDADYPREHVFARTQARQLVEASYERSAVDVMEYAALVVAFADSNEEVARRAAIRRRLDICRDSWGPLLVAAIKNWFTPEVAQALLGQQFDHVDLSRNPAKNIWTELAVTYKSPPKRITPDETKDGERYLEMLKGTGFDLFWQLVEFLLSACNEVLVWPDVIQRTSGEKKIKLRSSFPF